MICSFLWATLDSLFFSKKIPHCAQPDDLRSDIAKRPRADFAVLSIWQSCWNSAQLRGVSIGMQKLFLCKGVPKSPLL